jgi:hypothetical protein
MKLHYGILLFTCAFFLTLPVMFVPSWYDKYICDLSSGRAFLFVILWIYLGVICMCNRPAGLYLLLW